VRFAFGSLDRVAQVVQMIGYVNSAPGFTDQPRVVNGVTDLLVAEFRAQGLCAGAVIGCQGPAMGSSVEVALTVQFTGDARPALPTPSV